MVLGYIANESRRFYILVANRMQQIQDHTSPDQWHYVDTKLNPADHASRGLSAQQLIKSNWITGPAFLWNDRSQWSTSQLPGVQDTRQLSPDDPEVKKSVSLATNVEESLVSFSSRWAYFFDLHRAKRAVALSYFRAEAKERLKHESLLGVEEKSHIANLTQSSSFR